MDIRQLQDPKRSFGKAPTEAWRAFRKEVPFQQDPAQRPEETLGAIVSGFLKATPASTFYPSGNQTVLAHKASAAAGSAPSYFGTAARSRIPDFRVVSRARKRSKRVPRPRVPRCMPRAPCARRTWRRPPAARRCRRPSRCGSRRSQPRCRRRADRLGKARASRRSKDSTPRDSTPANIANSTTIKPAAPPATR